MQRVFPLSPKELNEQRQRLSDLNQQIESIKRPKGTKAKSKVDRAHELSNQHPDWTREQVIKAVNEEMQ
jgi:hypothetical protein